jgi:hypothetical protein
MLPIEPISSKESPRQILAEDYKSLNGGLPIQGGWGYTKDDACIIVKDDPLVTPGSCFNGISIEYVFVEKRIYEELIIFRPPGEKFSGIRWKLLEQSCIHEKDRVFDKLSFEITALNEKDWEELKAEFEGPLGVINPNFDMNAHEKKLQEKMVHYTRDFWFDITSFFGNI